MIEVKCDRCKKELDEPGAIVLSPPVGSKVDKYHVCTACHQLLWHFLHLADVNSTREQVVKEISDLTSHIMRGKESVTDEEYNDLTFQAVKRIDELIGYLVINTEQTDWQALAAEMLEPIECDGCYNCASEDKQMSYMIVCAKCGNKRCPHGTDHRLECTGSNEPQQAGSRYGGLRESNP